MSDLPSPKKHKTSNWSAIWVLPLVALAIGAWLAWRAFDQAGVDIQVRFESGDGIQANKTEVLYKGISVGKVTDLHVSKDIKGVVATIEIKKEAQEYLSKDTRFWLVKPRVSLAGVTGLETLVSGVYIAVDPVKGEKEERYFTALKEPPPLSDKLPGLHLTLKADRLGSLEQGSPVFYRQIQVGQVKSFQLGDDQRTIEIKVHIEPAYADLVRKHTRFWNASGISISGGLSGFKVHSESLLTLVAGGIAFSTPENRTDSPPTDPSKPFRLYDDYDAAQAGLRVKLKMNDVSGIDPGRTPVMFNGVQVGLVKSIDMGKDYSSATADLAMDPRVEDMLLEGTEFWTVKPSISLAGITGLEALVKGNYIDVRFAKSGAPSREFTIRPKAPPLNTDAPGLHLVLTSDKLGSIDIGAPILYRQVRVGSVQSYLYRGAAVEHAGRAPGTLPDSRRSTQPAGSGKRPAADPQCAAQGLDQAGQPGDLPADPGGQGRRPGLGRTGRPGADQHPHRTALRTAGAYRQPFLECQRLRRRRQPVQGPVATHRVDGGADGGRHCLRHPEQCADGRARQAGADLRPVRFGQ